MCRSFKELLSIILKLRLCVWRESMTIYKCLGWLFLVTVFCNGESMNPEPPVFVWPLNEVTETLEINYMTNGTLGEDVFLHEGYAPFLKKPLYFCGTDDCFAELDVISAPGLDGDICFRFYIFPLSLSGLILYFKASTYNASMTNELGIGLSDGSLEFILKGDKLLRTYTSDSQVTLFTWSLITVAYNHDESLTFSLDNSNVTEDIELDANLGYLGPLNVPGSITVAKDIYGVSSQMKSYLGSLTCLQIIPGTDALEYGIYDSYCAGGGGSSSTSTTSAPPAPTTRTSKSISTTATTTSSTTKTISAPQLQTPTSTIRSTTTTQPRSTTTFTPTTSILSTTKSSTISPSSTTSRITTSTKASAPTTSTPTTEFVALLSPSTTTISLPQSTSISSSKKTTVHSSTHKTTSSPTSTLITSSISSISATVPSTTLSSLTTPMSTTLTAQTTPQTDYTTLIMSPVSTGSNAALTNKASSTSVTTYSTTPTTSTIYATYSASTPSMSTLKTYHPSTSTNHVSTSVRTSTSGTSLPVSYASTRPPRSAVLPHTSGKTNTTSTSKSTDTVTHLSSTTITPEVILSKAIYVNGVYDNPSTCRRYRKVSDDTTLYDSDVISTGVTDDVRQCLQLCERHDGCGTFSYIQLSNGALQCTVGRVTLRSKYCEGHQMFSLG